MISRLSALSITLVSLGSCLYTDGINHAPQFEGEEISFEEASLVFRSRTSLRAFAVDDDGDTLIYRWYVTVQDLDNKRFALADTGGTLANENNRIVLGTSDELSLNLQTRGTYEVEVTVLDPQGAQSTSHTKFEVKNQPPEGMLRLVADPEIETAGDNYPAHAWYVVTAVDSSDPDDSLACDSGASIAWELRSPAGKKDVLFDHWAVLPCNKDKDVLDKLLLHGQPVSSSTEVVIAATITDPYGESSTAELSFWLQPNRPPCIRHTDPSFEAGKVVVLYDPGLDDTQSWGVGRRFDVTHLSDDVPEYDFRWLISNTEAGPYRPLAQQPGPTLKLESNQARPNDTIFLRVMVWDHERDMPDCPEEQRTCASDPSLPEACYQWVTWEVEYR